MVVQSDGEKVAHTGLEGKSRHRRTVKLGRLGLQRFFNLITVTYWSAVAMQYAKQHVS